MIRLVVLGVPGTVTVQQKGVHWRKRIIYEKSSVAHERLRIQRNIRFYNGTEYIRLKARLPHPFTGPIHLSVKYIFPFTKEDAEKHAEHLSDPKFEIDHVVRPDFDNSVKLLLDILTTIGCWDDDAQICDANIHKRRGSAYGIYIAFRDKLLEPLP